MHYRVPRPTLLILLILLFLGLVFWFVGSPKNIKPHPFQVMNGASQALVGEYYLPANSDAPYATVVLNHGISSQKETMAPLAMELAQHRIATVTFDFGGHGASYTRALSQPHNQADLEQIMAWVTSQPMFDPTRLGVTGHSMGGTTALDYALKHPELRGTVLLGIGGEARPTEPKNFMVGIGVYEQLNPVPITQELFASAISHNSDFAQGTVRNLFISSTSEHANAPYDPALITQTVQWFQRAFGLPESDVKIRVQWQIIGQALVYLAGIGLGTLVYQELSRKINYRILLLLVLGVLLVNQVQGVGGYWMLVLMPIVLLAEYFERYPPGQLVLLPLYGAVLYLMYALSLAIHGVTAGSLVAVPTGIFGFPILLGYIPFGMGYNIFYLVLHKLNSADLQAWVWAGLLLIFGAEWSRQGIVLGLGNHLTVWAMSLIRQPLHLQWQRPNKTTLIILPMALGVLMALVWQQWHSGLFTGEGISFAATILGFFVLLPVGLTLWILRSTWFVEWERQLEQH